MKNFVIGILLLPVYLIAGSNHWYFNEIGNEKEHNHSSHVQFLLNGDDFNRQLTAAPLTSASKRSTVIMDFPTPEGKMIQFEMFESPVMPERLSKKYPMIHTYTGRGIENPNDRVSVTKYNDQIKVLILSTGGRVFIDQLKNNDAVYRVSHTEFDEGHEWFNPDYCGTDDSTVLDDSAIDTRDFPYCVGEDEPCFEIGNNLVTFRYAGILTAEANNEAADGTVAGGLAWMAAMVNQINLVWARELSFRLEMIENSDLLIYTDENPTPEAFTAYNMYTELPLVLSHLVDVIGPGGYGANQSNILWEYGAVFNTGYGGGLAYVPGSTSANLPSYGIHIHEIGHNLGSSHNCTVEGGWRCTFGGTAMCNRGNTLAGSYGDQYSSHTIDIAIRYQNLMFSGSNYHYQTGWTQELTDNLIPIISVPESGFYIPKETPYVLEGSAYDGNANELLTYSWEQNDASNTTFSPNDFPEAEGPLVCSIDASQNGNIRFIPAMSSLLENNYSTGYIEALPYASREINMRFLVRDNDLYSGAFNYKNIRFLVDGNSGPFRVTSQSENETWNVGDNYLVEWNVANTDESSTVNCQSVDIFMAVNGSENFDHVLAENVPNNGSYEITVPELPSVGHCRIMVKSADNIFFDINNGDVFIQNNNLPEVSMDQSSIDLTISNESSVYIDRDITNVGEPGSILIYDAFTAIDYEGEGYLSFDGIDDNVNLGANILSGSGDFTISLWVRSASTNKVIIQQRNGGFNGEYQVTFNGNGQIHFWSYRDGYKWSATSSGSYNDNNWHHIAVVQDGTIDGGRIFVDGYEEAVNTGGGVVNLAGGIHTFLGADMRDNVNFLTGDINDVHIFTSALSPSEIEFVSEYGFGFNAAYNQGVYQNSGTLNASYQMLKMMGDVLTDLSGNDHDGNIDGASWAGDLTPIPDWLAVNSDYSWLNVGETESYTLEIDPTELLEDQNYTGKVIIISNASNSLIEIPISVTIGDDNLEGDVNLDGDVNVVDVVLVVNLILSGDFNTNADLNDDNQNDILDIVILVNIILNG